ncbi:GntR family transcriptional regulator [Ideonella benzenivorans]|uniref:GntR family transcriptional regulator n=1 Tax=Ideonella benzenivorans TaxID=2831643 RepID=UPI001CECD8C5|nr:GntR family transcriptional regulator [Ideonella benzenivorans]
MNDRVRHSDTVYRLIRQDIFDFRLLPGDRFAENDIAERLQVSRTPVHEALARLEAEGLVRGYFRNGWEVEPLNFARFDALYELRELLELQAVRKLCALPELPLEVRALRAQWSRPAAALAEDPLEAATLDEAFHATLVAGAGNPEIDRVLAQVTDRIRIMRRLDFAYGNCTPGTRHEHLAILHAIEAHDEAAAEAALRNHIRSGHASVQQITIERLEQARANVVHSPLIGAPARRKRFVRTASDRS